MYNMAKCIYTHIHISYFISYQYMRFHKEKGKMLPEEFLFVNIHLISPTFGILRLLCSPQD